MPRKNPNIKQSAGRNQRDTHYQSDKDIDKSVSDKENKDGVVGTMRIVIDGEKPFLEVKSSEGWVRSDNTSASGFSFKK